MHYQAEMWAHLARLALATVEPPGEDFHRLGKETEPRDSGISARNYRLSSWLWPASTIHIWLVAWFAGA